jgi:putative membrane protein
MERDLARSLTVGFVSGLAGTWTMSLFQGWWSRAFAGEDRQSAGGDHDARGWQERSEDQNANEMAAQEMAARTLGRPLTGDELSVAAPAVHYAFGAAMGALYGAMADRLPQRPPLTGALWGTAVWAGADEVAVPALRLAKPDAEYPAGAHLQSLASHVVYGVTTELIYRATYRVIAQRIG